MPKPKFPHFTVDESKVLEIFQKEAAPTGKWSYDVRLKSRKAALAKIENPVLQVYWQKVTAKRIDALVETATDINIIEVKRMMLSSGIGQLLLYADMYAEQFKPEKSVKLWYVTYYNDRDVEALARKLGIRTWSVVRL